MGAREAQAEFLQWRHLHLLDLLASLGAGHLLQIRRVSYHHKTIDNLLYIDIVDTKFLLIETLYLMFFVFNISKLPTWYYIHSFRRRQSTLAHGTELVPLGKPSIGLH